MKLFKYFTTSNTSDLPGLESIGQETLEEDAPGIEIKKHPGKVKSILVENLVCKQVDLSERRIEGFASTPVEDRGGDIVEVSAFLGTIEKFQRNPIMLFMHNMSQPIGVWDTFELKKEGLWVSGKLISGIPEADKAWTLIEKGVLRALSIGFIEVDGLRADDEKYHIRDLELLEISVVSIPMNQDALFTMSKGGKLLDIELVVPSKSIASFKEEEDMEKVEEQINELKSLVFAITMDSKNMMEQNEQNKVLFEKIDRRLDDFTNQITDLNKCMYAMITNEVAKLAEDYDVAPGSSPEPPEK